MKGPDLIEFKTKLKENLKPTRFKHFNCGFKFPKCPSHSAKVKKIKLKLTFVFNWIVFNPTLCMWPA